MRKTDFSYIYDTLTADLRAGGGQCAVFEEILHNTPYAPFAHQCFQWVSGIAAGCCDAAQLKVAAALRCGADIGCGIALCFGRVTGLQRQQRKAYPKLISPMISITYGAVGIEIHGADPPPRPNRPAALSSV